MARRDSRARAKALQTARVNLYAKTEAYWTPILALILSIWRLGRGPIDEMAARAKSPFVYGMISGCVLAETVGKITLRRRKEASMGHSIDIASKAFYPRWRVSVKTINTLIWPKYKSVAHLWAAYWLRAVDGTKSPFPCEC